MHRTPLSGTQRTRRTSARNLGTRALKNRLSRHRTPGRGSHRTYPCRSAGRCNRRDGTRRRSFVDRTRSGLRNNHARRGNLQRTRRWRGRATRDWSLRPHSWCSRRRRRRRELHRRSGWRSCRTYWSRNRRKRWNYAWSRSRSRLFRHLGDHFRSCSGRWRRNRRCGNHWRSGRGRWSHHRRRNRWLGGNNRHCGPNRSRGRFLLLRDGFQHISRPGDVRQIDLGLNFLFAAQRPRGTGGRGLRFGRAADMGPYLLRFMLLERTGMGLLLRHPDDR
jgi:hypothetical protein